ncbi:hypothetical protein M3J09_010456 [Ascochyta lentis]
MSSSLLFSSPTPAGIGCNPDPHLHQNQPSTLARRAGWGREAINADEPFCTLDAVSIARSFCQGCGINTTTTEHRCRWLLHMCLQAL